MESPAGMLSRLFRADGPTGGSSEPKPNPLDFLTGAEKQIVSNDDAIKVRFPERNAARGTPPVFEMVINDGERDRKLWAIVGQARDTKTGSVTDAYFFVDQENPLTLKPQNLSEILDALGGETVRGSIWIADKTLNNAITQKKIESEKGKDQSPKEPLRMALFIGNHNALARIMQGDYLKAVTEGRNIIEMPDPKTDPERYKKVWKAIIDGGNTVIGGILDRTQARKTAAAENKALADRIKELTASSKQQAVELERLRKQKDKQPTIKDLVERVNKDPYRALGVISDDEKTHVTQPVDSLPKLASAVADAKRMLLIAETAQEAEEFVVKERDGNERGKVVNEQNPPDRFRAALQLVAKRKTGTQPKK